MKTQFFLKILIIFNLIHIIIYKYDYFRNFIINKINLNYNYKFSIIQIKPNISTRGIMAYYFINMGCAIDQIYKGFIPIIDLASHPNIYNGFKNNSIKNPWEIFFNQPFGYTLENIKKKAKNIIYVQCHRGQHSPNFGIFYHSILVNYWHNFASIYMPIKQELINEANFKFKYLFHRTQNVLGILIRGTDYIAKKPFGHPIQPNPEMVFEDIIKMNKKNKYDWYFLTTEDDLIRLKFIKKFGNKLKYYKSKININYDYNKKQFLAYNTKIIGNISFFKIYVINIIILSKCLDLITSRTGGSIVALILTKGFRNIKVYYLGWYK